MPCVSYGLLYPYYLYVLLFAGNWCPVSRLVSYLMDINVLVKYLGLSGEKLAGLLIELYCTYYESLYFSLSDDICVLSIDGEL